jgi:phage shock protein PspC (stress-responsive transcriptional regulator)
MGSLSLGKYELDLMLNLVLVVFGRVGGWVSLVLLNLLLWFLMPKSNVPCFVDVL